MKAKERSRDSKTQRRNMPAWLAFLVVISIFVMICLSINFRSLTTMNEEVTENDQLMIKIQSVTDENLQLQEEIHNLKSDARVIKREAQRLGLAPREKVSVPTN
jgi:cell division protein FtsB